VSPRKPKIRIVLVGRPCILREGLKALIEIESDFDIVGEFGCVEDCLLGIVDLNADLLLTDLALPGRSGIEFAHRDARPMPVDAKIGPHRPENEEYIRAALNAGANGYVLKDANSAELMLAIRTVSLGHVPLQGHRQQKFFSATSRGMRPEISGPPFQRSRSPSRNENEKFSRALHSAIPTS